MASDTSDAFLDLSREASEADLDGMRAALDRMFPAGLPNLYRAMARHPRVLATLTAMKKHVEAFELTEPERCLVALEVAHASECAYCEAALCHYGEHALGLPKEVVEGRASVENRRLAVLIEATRAVMERKGKLDRAQIGHFEDQGVSFDQLLEIIAVVAEYTLATYSANLGRTRIDPEYRLD